MRKKILKRSKCLFLAIVLLVIINAFNVSTGITEYENESIDPDFGNNDIMELQQIDLGSNNDPPGSSGDPWYIYAEFSPPYPEGYASGYSGSGGSTHMDKETGEGEAYAVGTGMSIAGVLTHDDDHGLLWQYEDYPAAIVFGYPSSVTFDCTLNKAYVDVMVEEYCFSCEEPGYVIIKSEKVAEGGTGYVNLSNLGAQFTIEQGEYYRFRFQAQAIAEGMDGSAKASVRFKKAYLCIQIPYDPPDDPSNLDAKNPTENSIELTWTKGADSDKTKIMRKTGSYPTSHDDGTQVYFGTGTSTTDTGLNPVTEYYYRAWAYNTDTEKYSNGYSEDSETTIFGGSIDLKTPREGDIFFGPLRLRSPLKFVFILAKKSIRCVAETEGTNSIDRVEFKFLDKSVNDTEPDGDEWSGQLELSKGFKYLYSIAYDESDNPVANNETRVFAFPPVNGSNSGDVGAHSDILSVDITGKRSIDDEWQNDVIKVGKEYRTINFKLKIHPQIEEIEELTIAVTLSDKINSNFKYKAGSVNLIPDNDDGEFFASNQVLIWHWYDYEPETNDPFYLTFSAEALELDTNGNMIDLMVDCTSSEDYEAMATDQIKVESIPKSKSFINDRFENLNNFINHAPLLEKLLTILLRLIQT